MDGEQRRHFGSRVGTTESYGEVFKYGKLANLVPVFNVISPADWHMPDSFLCHIAFSSSVPEHTSF